MVWETFCIVFIQVVITHFYPKSCNSIGVLSLFRGKSCKSTKQDIKWRIEDMKIEVQWFLEGIWRQYKVKNIHLKFQCIARRKNAWKMVKNCWICIGGVASWTNVHEAMCPCTWDINHHFPTHPYTPNHAPRTWIRVRSVVFLFSKLFFMEKLYFHSLNLLVIMQYK